MTDKLIKNYIDILSGANKNLVPSVELDDSEWSELFELSNKRRTVAYCGTLISKMSKLGMVSEYILKLWTNQCFYSYSKELIRWEEVKKIVSKAEEKDVKLIFFKGYFFAELYPGFGLRNSSDTDFLVDEGQLNLIKGIMEEEYTLVEEKTKEKVHVYCHKKSGNYVEVHLQLWEDYEGKKIDILKGMKLTEQGSLIEATVFGQKLTTLNPTNHLIYQIFHIVKHYVVQGIGIRYLLDTSLFVNKHYSEIDWEYFWIAMKKLGYFEFCKQYFSLGNKYFDLKVEAIFGGKTTDIIDEEGFLKDMVLAGEIDEEQNGSYQIWGTMSPYVTGEIEPAGTKLGRKLQTLFPSAENIRSDFAYAKKYKFLLPIAWVHRFIDYGIYRIKHPNESYGIDTKLKTVEHRVEQVKNRGLI